MTTFTDDFNRADGSPGANWVQVSGTWSIITNRLSSGSAGGTIVIRAATAMATNDNSAQVTIATTGAVSHGVWCRGNTTITQGYLWRNDGTSWNLFSVVGGSFVSVGSFAGAAVAGDVAKIQAVGSDDQGLRQRRPAGQRHRYGRHDWHERRHPRRIVEPAQIR
jgi:hypothetical protein